jgi:hypothetical protein
MSLRSRSTRIALLAASISLTAVASAHGNSADHSATAPLLLASADDVTDERALRDQRKAAQQAREQLRAERKQMLADAVRTWRAEAAELEMDSAERLREIDTQFQLEEVSLQAAVDREIAGLEAELQKRMNARLRAGIGAASQSDSAMAAHMQAMEQEIKDFQAQLFAARRDGAERIHAARMAAQLRKDALLDQRDQQLLQSARALGLGKRPEPILATPIGGALTSQEEKWNEREQKEVERIAAQQAKMLAEVTKGKELRAWERANQQADFELDWQERAELQELESQKALFSTFMMPAAAGDGADQQDAMNRLADLGEQEKLTKIRYQQIQRENAIRRREAKRALLEP